MIDLAAIDDLASTGRRFVGWRWETRNGKPTKPPINFAGGYADSTNPDTWADLATAMAAVERNKLEGVGFVLDAARDGIIGIDLDGCREAETGTLAPWAQKVVSNIASYTEVSPSGTGVKILCRADPVPALAKNKRVIAKPNGHKAEAVEVYTTGRYFCITGQILDGVPDEIVDATEAVERLARWIASDDMKPKADLPAAFVALLEQDGKLRKAWETGSKIGPGDDTTASALDFSLAVYLRKHLDDADLTAVLRVYPHGQIGSGALKGAAAERRIARILKEVGPKPAEQTPQGRALDTIWAHEIELRLEEEMLIEGLLPRSGFGVGYGESGSGKTFVFIDLSGHVAAGIRWRGKEVEQGIVIYVGAENPEIG